MAPLNYSNPFEKGKTKQLIILNFIKKKISVETHVLLGTNLLSKCSFSMFHNLK